MVQSLTPLVQAMTNGIHRLELQEKQQQEQEEQRREDAASRAADETQQNQPRNTPKTLEDLQRRARRICVRLASMANICFWLSATEIVVRLLIGDDCIQSHYNIRLFTRQLKWVMRHCKRMLNQKEDRV